MVSELDRLRDDVAKAKDDVARLRKDNASLADTFREAPTDAGRDELRRAAAALAAARDRVEAARVALALFEKHGSPYGLLATEGGVTGCVAVSIAPGTAQEARRQLIDDAVTASLADAARELGVVLAASADRFTRERPGRDAEGRTVLDVAGRVEGDRLVPAVSSRAAKLRT